jgi:fibronectin-binding autotransporter adhesin
MRTRMRIARGAGAAVPALGLALLALAGAPGGSADPGGGTIQCTSDIPAYGPLNVSQPMGAGTSGSLVLGGDNNKFIGTCGLTGTIPSGWSVQELSGAALSAVPGAGNAGTFTWNTDDSTLPDSGTFTNSGTFVDESNGFSQQIAAARFVNTGTVRSESTGLSIGGTPAPIFDDRGLVEVDAGGTLSVGGTFVLDTGGTLRAAGELDIAGSTFEVAGGTVAAGVLVSPYRLGVAATALSFGKNLPASSQGTIDVQVPATLSGVVPKGWTLDLSASITATRGAGNAGAIGWASTAGNATFTDSGPFVNTGTFSDLAKGFSQQIQVPKFVNQGRVLSRAPGLALAGAGSAFDDRGLVQVDAGGGFASGGTFTLDRGGTIRATGTFDIAGSTFVVAGGSVAAGALTSPYHLGVGSTAVVFRPHLPASSHGKIEVQLPTKLSGTPRKTWKLVLDGGQLTH